MNTVQPGIFKGFIPPPVDSIFSSQFFNEIANNIMTLGTDAVKKNVGHQYRLRELEKEQVVLLQKLAHLDEAWKTMEHRFEGLIEDTLALQLEDEIEEMTIKDLESKIEEVLLKKDETDEILDEEEQDPSSESWAQKFSMFFPSVAQWAFNLSSLGIQNCYDNHELSNRIKIMKAQNDYLEQQNNSLKDKFDNFFKKNINLLKNGMETKRDLLGIKHTEPAKAYFAAAEAKKEVQTLKDKQKDLQKDFDALEGDYKIAKLAVDKISKEKQDLHHQVEQVKDKQMELDTLRQQMQQVKNQANRVQDLDQNFENLCKRLGFLPSKYKPEQKELDALEKEGKKTDYFSDSYVRLYSGLKTAPEVFRVGFAHALKKIYDMAEKDKDKIKLNRSLDTPSSKAAQIVYRFVALNWVQRGKIIATCQGYHELHLNNELVKMVPSLPENVLKQRDADGKQQYSIGIQFRAHDDFTPSEEILKNTPAARGIDPIAAKCLLATFNNEDLKHFFNILLEPAMEDDQPDYLAALEYVNKQPKKKQESFNILRDLICDMAVSLEAKFKHDVAMSEWQKYLDVVDFELQPFVKKEKEDLNVPAHILANQIEDEQLIPWQIQFDILSGVDSKGIAQQGRFCELIMNAQETYQVYFQNLNSELLLNPLTTNKVINNVTWNHIEKQFYKTHQLIGSHGCLLSNILAVIMVDTKELNSANIEMLKMAMANYLDDRSHAVEFEGALKNDFGCTVQKFQDWLRGKNRSLNHTELTTTVLEIAAYTLGVRIALFSPPAGSQDLACTKAKADNYGRLLPVEHIMGHYFGPPTEEVFFLAVEDDHTYYGLFPMFKLKGVDANKLGIDPNDFAVFRQLEEYWEAIDES